MYDFYVHCHEIINSNNTSKYYVLLHITTNRILQTLDISALSSVQEWNHYVRYQLRLS